jgi:hypothetical protein
MDIFSKKPSDQDNVTRDSVSNDTPTQPVVTQPVQPPVNQPVVKKEKHSRAFSFVSVLFLLTLLGAGVMTYMWYNQTAEVESLNQEIAQLKSEQEALKKQLAMADEASPDTATTPEPTTDEAQLTETATARYYAEVLSKNPDPNLKITISKLEQSFARVAVTGSDNSTSCIYKKVDGTWVWLYCAQAQTTETQDLDKRYGVPASIIRS